MNIKKVGTAIAAMLLASIGIVGCAQEDPDPCTWTASAEEYEKQTGRPLDRTDCEQAAEVDVDLKAPKAKKPKTPKPKTAQPAPKVNTAPKSGGKR